MKSKDNTDVPAKTTSHDLKRLSTDELQQRLDTYCLQIGSDSQLQPIQSLLNELKVHQLELEMQSRELRESQQNLEQARDRYADLYDFAPVCYINFDSAGCIHEINLTGARLLGQNRSRLLGRPFHLWLKRGDNGRAFFSHLKRARESGQIETIELQLQLGRKGHLDVRLETVIAHELIDDKPSFRCVIIDISERKRAERELEHKAHQLQLMADAIPAYIAYVDLHGIFQFTNKSYAAWVGKPREQLIGKKHADVVWKFANKKIEPYTIAALEGREVNFEMTIETPEREKQDISVSYTPDYAEDRTVLGYFIVNQDVTALHHEQTLDKMHLLEVAHVARINTMGEMVAELAHELNQPLAAISIYSDAVSRMLRKQEPNLLEMQQALNEIRLQAERAGKVILRLREFVSERELQREKIHINSLLTEVMNLIAVEARWHDVVVTLEPGEAIPEIVLDRILIEQVILNLARNAIEAMDGIEKAKRQLIIKTAVGNQKEIEISIADSGPGIPLEELEKIFEPFFTTKQHGMGLGLAICRSIVREHDGRLWAVPNEYGGTTFTIIFPHKTTGKEK